MYTLVRNICLVYQYAWMRCCCSALLTNILCIYYIIVLIYYVYVILFWKLNVATAHPYWYDMYILLTNIKLTNIKAYWYDMYILFTNILCIHYIIVLIYNAYIIQDLSLVISNNAFKRCSLIRCASRSSWQR